jgi:hypothetical protein
MLLELLELILKIGNKPQDMTWNSRKGILHKVTERNGDSVSFSTYLGF